MKFKEIPESERPRERLYMYGASKLSNEELLMIILKTGTKDSSIKDLSLNLLKLCGGIDKFKNVTINKLIKIKGIGKVKAIELMAVIELAKRMYESTSIKDIIYCTNPSNIIRYFNYLFKDKMQEEFYVIYLDNKKKYLDKRKLFVGSINSSISHPREIFKETYLLSASFIICIHNHPSGDVTPSREDIKITQRIKTIGELHGIYLVDHIIIGNNSYYSFYEDNNIVTHNN